MPDDFETALMSLRHAHRPRTLLFSEAQAPTTLAPWAATLNVETVAQNHHCPLATGSFVVLYDPHSQVGWNALFRLVVTMRAQVDHDMITNPLMGEVVWNWTHDCLKQAGAGFHDITGTVTREISESFGRVSLAVSSLNVELRASWSPNTPYLGEHLDGFGLLLCRTAGIMPVATFGK